VTVSTVGVVKNMYRLTDEIPLISMALSLHAPSQQVRVKIVPAASAHKIDKLMAAIDYHIQANLAAGKQGRITEREKRLSKSRAKGKVALVMEGSGRTSVEDKAVPSTSMAAAVVTSSSETDSVDEEGECDTGGLADDKESVDGSVRGSAASVAGSVSGSIAQSESKQEGPGSKGQGLSCTGERSRLMIEYILIRDVNDLSEHAHELGRLLTANDMRRDHVILNLIPYNPTAVAEDYR
jgi:hypothetical protein